MAEYIEREVVLKSITVDGFKHFSGCLSSSEVTLIELIRDSVSEIPAADVVPVVRCEDCGNHSESDGNHYCKFWRMYCPDDSDFFCKAGKLREVNPSER